MTDSITNTPTGDKVQVSKDLHDQTYQNYMRALDTASCFRLVTAVIPKNDLIEKQLEPMWQTVGDIQAVLEGTLEKLCLLSDFITGLDPEIHKDYLEHRSRSFNVVSIMRLLIRAIPEGPDNKAVQLLSDIHATLSALLPDLSAIADFLDTLQFSVMEVKEDNQGGEL